MKFKDFVNVTTNKKTHQVSWHLKLKEVRRKGLTFKQLLEMSLPEPIKSVTKLK